MVQPVRRGSPPADAAAIASAREAMQQKMQEVLAQMPEQPATPVVAQPPAPEVTPMPKPLPMPAPTPVALEKHPAPAPPPAVIAQKQPEKKPTPAPHAPAVFVPIEGPASSIAIGKQQRLEELLGRYKSDTITPEQYHNERAKILAEP